jgi:hypothetical protein
MQVVCRTKAYILKFFSKNYMAYILKRGSMKQMKYNCLDRDSLLPILLGVVARVLEATCGRFGRMIEQGEIWFLYNNMKTSEVLFAYVPWWKSPRVEFKSCPFTTNERPRVLESSSTQIVRSTRYLLLPFHVWFT